MQWLNYRTRDRRGRAPVLSLLVGTKFVTISDADKVRKDHRIVGTPVGCLPRSPFQNGCLGLPVQLSMEEAHLLVVKGLAILVKNNRLSKEPTNDDKSRLEKFADDIYHEQAELVMSQRREEIIQYADRIVAGMYFKTTGQYISKRMRRKMKKARLQGEGPSSVSEQTLPEPPSVDIEAQRETVISQQMKTVVPPTRDITYTPVLTGNTQFLPTFLRMGYPLFTSILF